MIREELLKLINNKNWKIIKDITIQNLVAVLDFQESMSLAYDLFFENLYDKYSYSRCMAGFF